MALDQNKLNEMLHRGVNDFGATFHAACVMIGDKLGLYKGPVNSGGWQTSCRVCFPYRDSRRNATFANGLLRKPPADTSRWMPKLGSTA